MKILSTFLLVIGLCMCSPVFAQDTLRRELGIRTSSLNSFGFIYKKKIKENVYRRHRLAFGSLGLNFAGNNTSVGFSAGGATGKEKRRSINDKLQLIYGTELIAGIGLITLTSGSITVDNGNGTGSTIYEGSNLIIVTPSVGIGFVLGAQYNFNPRWYVSGELIPSIEVSGSFGNVTSIYRFNAGFNSSSVGLTGAYRF
ncbi:hypothetical protein [Siphonobacter sp. SORGH_AS_1065]|uniref:hypothetical protein n=1 Tax=Siphonobacter sp. SORGH_AS_1065 TaxID=3041795 RepID=UPI00278229C4|nr:hypothetical protein [Siphonobacter sp. SORGH_AS_1065]MDQ1086977.1 hypothetical protein [Siphonobacter sp. SORGH_AS_1065]